ncbi:MAG: metallophosphatase family protein [Bacteroidales bacterium]|nr:metallophosphatase family protein [Bacteroidales bacterium]
MKKIGLISDTHAYYHPKLEKIFSECDEIWHAGDIGNIEIVKKLSRFKTFKAVFGNMDGYDIRCEFPEIQIFECEKVKVVMMHIGGYPGNYSFEAKKIIAKEKPQLFISGHSHILKVINDKKNNLLHMNPGAAGKSGIHKTITMLRFKINKNRIEELEVIEFKKND